VPAAPSEDAPAAVDGADEADTTEPPPVPEQEPEPEPEPEVEASRGAPAASPLDDPATGHDDDAGSHHRSAVAPQTLAPTMVPEPPTTAVTTPTPPAPPTP
jgi:hypothetical protein